MKPIVLMYVPNDFYVGKGGSKMSDAELMRIFNGWEQNSSPAPEFLDYLWLIFTNSEIIVPEIQVFHPKDFTDIQDNELKNLVEEKLKELQNTFGL